MDPIPTTVAPAAPATLLALYQRFRVRRLDMFGSAADGHFEPMRSDLDFLVAFEELTGNAYADAYFGLREGLAELFGREVDLITEPALENPYLRRQARRSGIGCSRRHDGRPRPSAFGMPGARPSASRASPAAEL